MAKIIEKMGYNELLGDNTQKFFDGCRVEEQEVNYQDTVINNLDYREAILKRMAKNNKKLYNKGVIKLDITCSNCGKQFHVQMSYKQYHYLLLLHRDKIQKENRVANGTEIASMFSTLRVSLPVKEVFLFELCPACISKWKCQRLGNNATNVEKTSL